MCPEPLTLQGNNLIGATDGSSGWVGSDLTGTVAQPLNPLLAPLANYGGPTNTMALLPDSPAINAGSNALLPAGITTDQRGFNRIAGGTVDIGAFESQPIPLVVNTTADGIDVPPGKLTCAERSTWPISWEETRRSRLTRPSSPHRRRSR